MAGGSHWGQRIERVLGKRGWGMEDVKMTMDDTIENQESDVELEEKTTLFLLSNQHPNKTQTELQ